MSDYLRSKKEQKVKAKGELVRKDKASDVQMDENSDGRNGANIIDLKDAQCELALHKPYGTQKPSEHGCFNVWATIFGMLMELVTFHTGEKALKASKIMRGMQREEYGEPLDAGWKVDCVFMFDGIELSNIELKSQNASPRDVNLNIWVRISIKVDASAYWDSVLTCRHKQSVRYARNIL